MTGRVNEKLEAVLRVRVFGTGDGRHVELDGVIDTGFSGGLTLPGPVIAGPGLDWLSVQNVELADGQVVLCDVYAAEAE